MTERIGILIDLEGMGHLYRSDEYRFYTSVDCLLSNGIRMANICSENGNNRYFLHQMGADGFLAITAHGYKATIDLPVAFSIVLLQVLLLNNAIGKCGIAQGDFADIQGCLPETEALHEHFKHKVRSSGFMTRLNVMGHALLNAYNAATAPPRGGRLIVTKDLQSFLPSGLITNMVNEKYLSIDWVHSNPPAVDQVYASLQAQKPSIEELERALKSYIEKNKADLSSEWITGTLASNGL